MCVVCYTESDILPVVIGAVMMALAVLVMIVVIVLVILFMHKRRRRGRMYNPFLILQ